MNAELKSQQFSLMIGIFQSLCEDCNISDRDFHTFQNRLLEEGISFATITMPLLGKAIDSGLSSGTFVCPTNFKTMKSKSALPAFLGSLVRRIFASNGDLLDDACHLSITFVRQICFMFYKLDVPYKEAKSLQVVENFLVTEKDLALLDFEFDAILKVASILIGQITNDYNHDTLKPKHGPGATSNFKGRNKFDKKLAPLQSVYNFGNYHFLNHNDGVTRLNRYPVMDHRSYFDDYQNSARVILVPKDSRGPRLISCEPVENQFVQQGILNYLMTAISEHPYTKGHVNFADQTINQNLAVQGSLDQSYSTLDLKEASDRVSLRLVQMLFSLTPELLSDLMLSRSTSTVLPNGDSIKLLKFAPMGSACCFPVMSLCIWALCVSYILGSTGSLQVALDSVFVYGDDIIVETQYAQAVIHVLQRYGLQVNVNKSFINSRFCESCGTDAFEGTVVTPIRLRKTYDFSHPTTSQQPERFVSMVEFGNLMFENGYLAASNFVFSIINRYYKVPYGSRTSPYLHRLTFEGDKIRNLSNFAPYSAKPESSRYIKIKKDLIRYPLGYTFRALMVSPCFVEEETSEYGHLSRILRLLGQDIVLPGLGSYSEPRRIKVKYRSFDHYSM